MGLTTPVPLLESESIRCANVPESAVRNDESERKYKAYIVAISWAHVIDLYHIIRYHVTMQEVISGKPIIIRPKSHGQGGL